MILIFRVGKKSVYSLSVYSLFASQLNTVFDRVFVCTDVCFSGRRLIRHVRSLFSQETMQHPRSDSLHFKSAGSRNEDHAVVGRRLWSGGKKRAHLKELINIEEGLIVTL